jgi:peptide/nickel transport system permease protein
MIRALTRKSVLYLLALAMVVGLNFSLVHLMPGDALVHLIGEEGYAHLSSRQPETLARLRAEYGLDRSPPARALVYLKRLVRGDWGWSYHHGQPVAKVIGQRLGWTLRLLVPAVLIASLLAAWIGALSGWRSRHGAQRVLPALFLFVYAVPAYGLGMILVLAAARLDLFVPGGMGGPTHGLGAALVPMILPLTVLVIHGTAYKYMIMRHAVRQETDAPYVLTALSKGLSPRQVLFGHVLKNVLGPYLAVVALNLGFMVGGTLLVEVVFSLQGMGTLIYQAVLARDYPMLSGALLALALSVLAANAAADMAHALIDPRIREGQRLG